MKIGINTESIYSTQSLMVKFMFLIPYPKERTAVPLDMRQA